MMPVLMNIFLKKKGIITFLKVLLRSAKKEKVPKIAFKKAKRDEPICFFCEKIDTKRMFEKKIDKRR